MFVSKNVPHRLASSLSRVASIGLTSYLGRYLGVPLIHKKPMKETYQFILDRIQQRLSSWKASTLSFAGRVTLAKSVLQAFLPYCMQTMLLPKGVCNQLEKMQRGLIWGAENETRSMSQVSWDVVCSSKNQGGLRVRRMT